MFRNLRNLLVTKFTSSQCTTLSKWKNSPTGNNNGFKSFSTSVSNHSAAAVPLSYSIFQPEGQPVSQVPVLILHGLLGSKQNWRGLGKAICARTKRNVYILDARNHGDSPHATDFSYPIMAEDVKYFMKSHAIPEAMLIGHSMGGRSAMYLAITNKNLVNKLVVVDMSPKVAPVQANVVTSYMGIMKKALAVNANLSLVKGRKAIDTYFSKTIQKESIRQFLLTNLTEKNGVLGWKANVDLLMEKFDSEVMGFPSVTGHYSGDTLFIYGGDSPFVKSEDHPYIKTFFPKAEFVGIPNAGHWVHSEKPSEFLQTVCDFL